MGEYEKSRGHDNGGPPPIPRREQHEPTPEEKARTASAVAAHIDDAHGAVVAAIEDVWRAHEARDLPAYLRARRAAENAVQRVRHLATGAKAHALDTSNAAARAKLEQAEALAEIEEKNLAAAPDVPAPVAPTLRMEAALLAALPPIEVTGSYHGTFETARNATSAVLRQLPFSDIQALELILGTFPDHPIAIRFHKLKDWKLILNIIKDPTNRAKARAREAATPKVTAPPPAFTAPTLIAPPSAFVAESEARGIEGAAPTPMPEAEAPAPSAAPELRAPVEPGGSPSGSSTAPAREEPPQDRVHKRADPAFAPGGAMYVEPSILEVPASKKALATPEPTTPEDAPTAPREPLNPSAEAEKLRTAILTKDRGAIFDVLQRNAYPTAMGALMQRLGGGQGVARRLRYILAENEWARARAYLGDQVPLDLQIETHDAAGIMRDLQALPDHRALDLFTGATAGAVELNADNGGDGAGKGEAGDKAAHAPSPTTLAQVQSVLRAKLDANGYAAAMRLLLDKAERALSLAKHAKPPPGVPLDDFTVTPADIRIDPSDPTGGVISVLGGANALDPISSARVDLAEERIRAGDASGDSAQAFASLADLRASERKALALRLRQRPLVHTADLAELAEQTDDAKAIHDAIVRAQFASALQHKAMAGIDLDAAVARAGELVRAARRKLDELPPDAPEAERKQAQDELRRLERMFFGDTGDSAFVRGALRTATGGDPKAYADQLHDLGADPVTVGRELLAGTPRTDFEALIGALKLIPAEHRVAALEASGKLGDLSGPWWTKDQREVLAAYVEQGRRAQPVDPKLVAGEAVLVLPADGVLGPSPEATIALHEIIAAMATGPQGASFVLVRLVRLTPEDYAAVVSDPRFREALAGLPVRGTYNIEDERDLKQQLTRAAQSQSHARAVIENYPTGGERPGQAVRLEASRLAVEDKGGRGRMRRAYVLKAKIEENPALVATLSPDDQALLRDYDKLQLPRPTFDTDAERTQFDEITLGQVQLTDTAEGALDANTEAEFLRTRLHKLAKVPLGASLASWHHDRPEVTEALNEFEVTYQNARPGGIKRSDLAILADIYYRARLELEEWERAFAENQGLAAMAATVAGTVVACVVLAASGGALAPAVLGALSSFSAGTASAIAGMAVRWESSGGSILTDFGAGTFDGLMTVAATPLAARIVRGSSAGVAAGHAAAQAGSTAAHAGGPLAARVAQMAIEGAIGGASGELFQTAVDEATWDRGVMMAFARMLAAIARGAAMGAALGGGIQLVGGLARVANRVGHDAAEGVAHLLDTSQIARRTFDTFSEHVQDELARAYTLGARGHVDEMEKVIARLDELPEHMREAYAAAARAYAGIRSTAEAMGIDAVELQGKSYFPHVVEEKEFKKLTGGKHQNAAVIIENGEPQIIVRKGAPASAVNEEVMHVHQFHTDPLMRQRMGRLSEENLSTFKYKAPAEKLQLHIDKLEVEADAQRKIIAQLEYEAEENPDLALRLADADETLFSIEERLDTLQGARKAGTIDEKALGLGEQPRLYAGGVHSKQPTGWRAKQRAKKAEALVGADVDDAATQKKLEGLGYTIHRDKKTGKIIRIARREGTAATNELPHLQIEGSTIKKGEGVTSFADRKRRAGAEFVADGKKLGEVEKTLAGGMLDAEAQAQAQIQRLGLGTQLRAGLVARVEAGTLDVESAGLVARWGKVAEKLESDSQGVFKVEEFLARIPNRGTGTSLSEADIDKLRRWLRGRTLDYIEGLQQGEQRTKALHGMLDIQPDPGSKGELFHSYRERVMGPDNPHYNAIDETPKQFHGDDLANRRRPDGSMNVQDDPAALLSPGKYAVEDKAGKEAFKIDQAQDYTKRAYPDEGGFKLAPTDKATEYDGLVYVFSKSSEAEEALKKMTLDPLISGKKVLGREPGGIHVMYFDESGTLKRMTPRWSEPPPQPKPKRK